MATRILMLIVAVLAGGCTEAWEKHPATTYCDTEMEYRVWKLGDGEFLLLLRVGPLTAGSCGASPMLNRKINLEVRLASLDEVYRVIDEHRKKYSDKAKECAVMK